MGVRLGMFTESARQLRALRTLSLEKNKLYEIPPLIAQALMSTADRIQAGLPIDATRSVKAAARRV